MKSFRRRFFGSRLVVSVTAGLVAVAQVAVAQEVKHRSINSELQSVGQIQSKPSTQTRQQTDQERNRHQVVVDTAIQALQNVADDTSKWENAVATARALGQIADILWDYDVDLARGYLIKAWDSTSKVKQTQAQRSRYRNGSVKADVRREVLLVARKRAPELSAKWLDQITSEEANSSDEESNRGVFDDRSNRSAILLQMALSTLPQDPSAAAQLAIESLNDGISFGLQAVLIGLQEKNPGLAQTVFRAALARLQNADPSEGLILYAYLYTPGRILAPNTSPNRGDREIAVGRSSLQIKPAAEVYPQLALEFLIAATNSILNAPPPSRGANPEATARAQVTLIDLIVAKMGQSFPQQASALLSREAAILMDAHFSPAPAADNRAPTDVSKAQDSGRRVEELEQIAEREPLQSKRDILYARAGLATSGEDYERGLAVADRIHDEDLRAGIRNWVIYRAAHALIQTKDFDQAHKLLARNSNAVQRAAGLVVGAQALIGVKETITAREWLNEAESLVKRMEVSDDQIQVEFGIVAALGNLDKTAALEALSTAVNLIGNTAQSLFDTDRAPSHQTFSLPGIVTPDPTYDTKNFGLHSAIRSFTTDQLEPALQLLGTIKRPEIKGLAIVLLCGEQLRRESLRSKVSHRVKISSDPPLLRIQVPNHLPIDFP